MRKASLALALTAAALLTAGEAHAKGLKIVGVCGPNGCNKIEQELAGWRSEGASYTNPARYYVVRIGFEGAVGQVRSAFWLPDSGWFSLAEWGSQGCWYEDCWVRLASPTETMLQHQTTGMEPFRPHLDEVTVGGRPVANPDAYLPLFGNLRWAVIAPEKLHFTRIVVRPDGSMPWLRGPAILGYDARHRVLVRDDGHFRVPKGLAARLLDRPSFATSSRHEDSSSFYAGLGVSALAGVVVVVLAKRKRKENP